MGDGFCVATSGRTAWRPMLGFGRLRRQSETIEAPSDPCAGGWHGCDAVLTTHDPQRAKRSEQRFNRAVELVGGRTDDDDRIAAGGAGQLAHEFLHAHQRTGRSWWRKFRARCRVENSPIRRRIRARMGFREGQGPVPIAAGGLLSTCRQKANLYAVEPVPQSTPKDLAKCPRDSRSSA